MSLCRLAAPITLLLASGLLHASPLAEDPLRQEQAACAALARSPDGATAVANYLRAQRLLSLFGDDDALEAFAKQVAGDGQHPLSQAQARYTLAQLAYDRGELDDAHRKLKALGLIEQALVVGPSPNTGGEAFATPLEPKPQAWHDEAIRVAATPDGWLDLGAQFHTVREQRFALAFGVASSQQQALALRLAVSGQARVSLNGHVVATFAADHVAAFDQLTASLPLVAGDNVVVVEFGSLSHGAQTMMRITDARGDAVNVATFADAKRIMRALSRKTERRNAPPVTDVFAAPARDAVTSVNLHAYLRVADTRKHQQPLIDEFKRAIEQTADVRARAVLRARLALERADEDKNEARRLIDQALVEAPDNILGLIEAASLAEDAGDVTRARQLLARAVATAPHFAFVQERWLRFRRANDNTPLTVDNEVLALAGRQPSRRLIRLAAEVLRERGAFSAAEALLVAPRLPLALDRAEVKLARLHEDDTVPLAQRITAQRALLKLSPERHSTAEALATRLQANGQRKEADALVAERLATFPKRLEPLWLKAQICLLREDRACAKAATAAARQLVPSDVRFASLARALDDNDPMVERFGQSPPATPLAPGADAVLKGADILLQSTTVQLFDNGLYRMLTDRVIRIVDAKRAGELRKQVVSFTPAREDISVLLAERIDARGQRHAAIGIEDRHAEGKDNGTYNDASARIVDFGALQDGDVLHLRTRREITDRHNMFGDFFGFVEPISSTLFTHRYLLTIEHAPSRTLHATGRGVPQPVLTTDGDHQVSSWQRDNIEGVTAEPYMPAFMDVADFISVSTYADWRSLGDWYTAFVAPQLVPSADMIKAAEAIQAEASDKADLVRRIYEHVITHTRYVGIELGVHGWKPYPVAEIYRRRFGDCKDKASLLVALLKLVNVDANLVLVRTRDLGQLSPTPATMWAFNHAIAYVPSLDLYLDGTAELSGAHELPAMDQGAQALVVGPHGQAPHSELVTIKAASAEQNFNASTYTLRLSMDGALDVDGHERFTGTSNARERRNFMVVSKQKDKLTESMAETFAGIVIHDVTPTSMALGAAEVGYDFHATIPHRALRDRSGGFTLPISLYPHGLSSYVTTSTRKNDIVFMRNWRTRNTMRYVLPPGVAAIELPPSGQVKTPYFRFSQTITPTADGFVIDEDTVFFQTRIPARDYSTFQKAALQADALMERKIRLRADAAPAPSSRGGTP